MKLSKRRKQDLTSEYLKKQQPQPEPGHVFNEPKVFIEGSIDFSSLTGNLVCYFDGACEPMNPGGNMGIGACIRCGNGELFAYSDFVQAAKPNTNNVAEYMAFEKILDFFIDNKCSGQRISIYGDSKLVINQMFGDWKMNGGLYIPYAKRCIQKLAQLRVAKNRINGTWIRREQNGYADELSKKELINHNVEFRIQPLSVNLAQ